MRAALCASYGDPEVVEVVDLPVPKPGPGAVLVRVEAAAVNFPDVLLIANKYQVSVPPPFVPGSEFAGEVVDVADDVTTVSPGDRVFGTVMVGAFAEEASVAATSLTPIPDGIEARHAAAFGVAHRTAYHVLRTVAAVQPGQEVVVLGAGGGVGLAAVQLGPVLGANVTAVASSAEKLRVAEANGAARTINHRSGDLRQLLKEALPAGADVVVDPVGGTLSEPALRSLRWGGRFVTVGYAAGEVPRIPLNLVLLKGVHILGFEFRGFTTHAAAEMQRNDEELLELLRTKLVRPHIGASFSLADTAAALRYVGDGKAIGKVVLEI
jgi:NADPH2:quinone reductase